MASGSPGFGVPIASSRKECAPVGRVCADPSCDTVLSRYNDSPVCSVHSVRPVRGPQKRVPWQPVPRAATGG